MKTVSFVTQKGGSGKTTLAASLAVAAEEAGEKVFILDLDSQKTITTWLEHRENPSPAADSLAVGGDLPAALAQIRKLGYSLTILDTPGKDEAIAIGAIAVSDLCLIPARPTTFDLAAAQATLRSIIKLDKRFAFIMNQTSIRSSRTTDAVRGLRSISAPVADVDIPSRMDHQDATGVGLGVTEFNTEGKAAREIRQLWKWIKRQLEEKKSELQTQTA